MQPITQIAPTRPTYLLWQEAVRRSAAARDPLQHAHRTLLTDLCHTCESTADGRDLDDATDPIATCFGVLNPSRADFDGDGLPDVCDTDDDNDGDPDGTDPDPLNAAVNTISLQEERSEPTTFIYRRPNAPFNAPATVGEIVDLLA